MNTLKLKILKAKESVWDYPRPPRVEESNRRILVFFQETMIAGTIRSRRVLETSHPPVYYIPPDHVRMELLIKKHHYTFCEWKGSAIYYDIRMGEHLVENAAWSYEDPSPEFESIRKYIAFYASNLISCSVDGEEVIEQPGDFYGGWITSDIVGPFKGSPGTTGW